MSKRPKVAKLLAPTTPLVLEVEGGHRLEIDLAWTMRAVILIESRLRLQGIEINALQNPSSFWTNLDCTMLAIGLWACAIQEQPEYADEDGFEVISSFIVTDNYAAAATALKSAFLESLSKERRDEIKAAEEKELNAPKPAGESPTPDPTPAPVQL